MARSTTRPTPTHPKTSNLMTLQEVLDELGISKSTWNDWKNKGNVPRYFKLPNGQIRVRRADFEEWLERQAVVTA